MDYISQSDTGRNYFADDKYGLNSDIVLTFGA
jgi:hypothetical protein